MKMEEKYGHEPVNSTIKNLPNHFFSQIFKALRSLLWCIKPVISLAHVASWYS